MAVIAGGATSAANDGEDSRTRDWRIAPTMRREIETHALPALLRRRPGLRGTPGAVSGRAPRPWTCGRRPRRTCPGRCTRRSGGWGGATVPRRFPGRSGGVRGRRSLCPTWVGHALAGPTLDHGSRARRGIPTAAGIMTFLWFGRGDPFFRGNDIFRRVATFAEESPWRVESTWFVST